MAGNDRSSLLEQLGEMTPEKYAAHVNRDHWAKVLGLSLEEMDREVAAIRAKKTDWRAKFRLPRQLAERAIELIVADILPEGVSAIGSLTGVGKTWFALSMARAIATGTKFLGMFEVPKRRPVLYLVPEMGDRSLRSRLEKFGMLDLENFYCQTVMDGITPLDSPLLRAAITEIKPVVFFDTIVRFNEADDENAARQNSALLASSLFGMIRAGSPAVVALHHSPKYAAEATVMTVENTLRGTGDFGAMCDCVWGLRHAVETIGKKLDQKFVNESSELTRLDVQCLKARDIQPASPFRIQGRPYIDQKKDFVILDKQHTERPSVEKAVVTAIVNNKTVSVRELMKDFGVGYDRAVKIAEDHGWVQSDGEWRWTNPKVVSF